MLIRLSITMAHKTDCIGTTEPRVALLKLTYVAVRTQQFSDL